MVVRSPAFRKVAMPLEYQVRVAAQPPSFEGDWNRVPWKEVVPLRLTNFMGVRPEHFPRTEAKLAYDDLFLYVLFHVEDQYIRATAREYQDNVCRDSCVEFFFTPQPDRSTGYFNVEVNCGGTMLFNHQTGPGVGRRPVTLSDADQIILFHSMPQIVDPEVAEPCTWLLEYRLPLEVLMHYSPVAKPAPGVKWYGNLYKCADATSHPHWLTWSPVDYPRPNFHLPQFFGLLKFM